MTHRTVIYVLFVGAVAAVLACGGQAQGGDAPVPTTDDSVSAPAPSGSGPSPHAAVPLPNRVGDTSIEEKIALNAVIVRASLVSVSADKIVDDDGNHRAILKFHLNVAEYLKGTGPAKAVAIWIDGRVFDTAAEADTRKAEALAERDTQWDSREAVIFLGSEAYPIIPSSLTQPAGHFVLSVGNRYLREEDFYSLHSYWNKLWLPEATPSSGGGGTGGRSVKTFLLDVPSGQTSGTNVRSPGSSTPTILLTQLQSRITAVTAELNAGDGSYFYKSCVKSKYNYERRSRFFSAQGKRYYARIPQASELSSGQPANTVIHESQNYGAYPSEKAVIRLGGSDGALFTVNQGTATNEDANGDGNLEAGVDRIAYPETYRTTRPLSAGTYVIEHGETGVGYKHCSFEIVTDWTVTVTAPEHTLHEALFDPVDMGDTVAADSSNGQFEPAAFTDANGASATIQRIEWASDTVKAKVSPHTGLAGHKLDFIELDGSVSLSLVVDEATVDAANGTLSWAVAEQPWEDGDKLMVRIREAW